MAVLPISQKGKEKESGTCTPPRPPHHWLLTHVSATFDMASPPSAQLQAEGIRPLQCGACPSNAAWSPVHLTLCFPGIVAFSSYVLASLSLLLIPFGPTFHCLFQGHSSPHRHQSSLALCAQRPWSSFYVGSPFPFLTYTSDPLQTLSFPRDVSSFRSTKGRLILQMRTEAQDRHQLTNGKTRIQR